MRLRWYVVLMLGSFFSCNDEAPKPIVASSSGSPDIQPAISKAVDILDKDYHIVTTPKGGHYHLLLPDGSQVWLNAASSITYPNQFGATERKVSITGEAYFEIKHHAASHFVVEFDAGPQGQCGLVEVIGTHFNVKAYPNEPAAFTTLFEGKVRMASEGNLQSAILKPGELAIMQNESVPIYVRREDTTHTWKKGWFRFDKKGMPGFCRDLERWYDISVHLDGKAPHKEAVGAMQRNTNLSVVVDLLKKVGLSSTYNNRTLVIHN